MPYPLSIANNKPFVKCPPQNPIFQLSISQLPLAVFDEVAQRDDGENNAHAKRQPERKHGIHKRHHIKKRPQSPKDKDRGDDKHDLGKEQPLPDCSLRK